MLRFSSEKMPLKHASVDVEYEKNKELKREDVQALLDWAEKQPHLPTITGNNKCGKTLFEQENNSIKTSPRPQLFTFVSRLFQNWKQFCFCTAVTIATKRQKQRWTRSTRPELSVRNSSRSETPKATLSKMFYRCTYVFKM